jgi:hypothetical protein
MSHSRCAASKAGRNSTGPRPPTSNSACGIDRPSALVWILISSMSRGHESCAVARRLVLRARDEAIGNEAANAPSVSAGSGAENST